MTLGTFVAVTAGLKARGIPAYLNWPGCITIAIRDGLRFDIGDVNSTVDIDVVENDELIETIESILPRDTMKVDSVVDFIACHVDGWRKKN